MRVAMITFATAFAGNMLAGAAAQEPLQQTAPVDGGDAAISGEVLTPDAINASRLDSLLQGGEAASSGEGAEPQPEAAVVRLQVLLDRSGASPGVIDGFMGENVDKAIAAFEAMHGLPVDGRLDPDLITALEQGEQIIGTYVVTTEDVEAIVPPIPEDYAEKAERDFLGYESVPELVAERFHMDLDLLEALNPGAGFSAGDEIFVSAYGPGLTGTVAYIQADKAARQVRAYDADDRLLAAYPATIGSEDNPSPSGIHEVEAVAPMPNYTYNPEVNFQQGDNTEVLTIPPGPNGPVGSMWIDLSEPTYGIHGTPEPELIDKVASHGCVRLTNWDAEELAGMVAPGVTVEFME